jgi:hypothetical protein
MIAGIEAPPKKRRGRGQHYNSWDNTNTFTAANTAAGDLQRAIYDLLVGPKHAGAEGGLPTSCRFVFYELVQMGVIGKSPKAGTKRGPAQNVNDALMHLRKVGKIPWSWITDETRSLTQWNSASSMYQYVVDSLSTARLDLWEGSAPLILTESRSLAGVLEETAGTYLCPIAATNGQVGGFLHTDIIPILSADDTVLYLGDFDNQGVDIEANTRREIEAETGPLTWERLALTSDQVEQYAIPSKPKTDKRFTKNVEAGQSLAWETEALSQTVIQDLLRERLEELLPAPLGNALAREKRERTKILKTLSPLRGGRP